MVVGGTLTAKIHTEIESAQLYSQVEVQNLVIHQMIHMNLSSYTCKGNLTVEPNC